MFVKALSAFVLSMIGAAFFTNQVRLVYLQNVPPLKVTDGIAEPKSIKSGEPLAVRFTVDRNRFCDADISLFIETGTDLERRVLWRSRAVGGTGMLGTSHTTSVFDIPALPPGDYRFRLVSYARCAEDRHTILAPTADFTIVP